MLKFLLFLTLSVFISGALLAQDSDNDGLVDANEITLGTNPNNHDTDGDGVFDGTEVGLVIPNNSALTDLSLGHFRPDANPATQTNPRIADTDGGGVSDGWEDRNKNGLVEPAEGNPNNPSDDATLALTLTSLKVNVNSNNNVVSWVTENEGNVFAFEIQKSTNGVDFFSFNTVNALNGTANTYTITDNINTGEANKTIYYRIKQINNDNTFSYSTIVIASNTDTKILSLYPNPVVDYFKLYATDAIKSVDMYNASGILVQKWVNNQSNTYMINNSVSGVYFLKIVFENQVQYKKIVIN